MCACVVVLQVLDKMNEIKQTLGECVFAWSCQRPLDRPNTLRLLQHLKALDGGGVNADGSLDDVTLALLMALLYAVDVRILEQEDSEGKQTVMVAVQHVHAVWVCGLL